jgi:hypothetical protein
LGDFFVAKGQKLAATMSSTDGDGMTEEEALRAAVEAMVRPSAGSKISKI